MCFQTVWQGNIAIGSIFVIHFNILETSMTLHILAFWYPIFWIYFNSKYECVCTNMQYCQVKPPADAYVTVLRVFANSDTRLYSNWINTCYPFHNIRNLYDFIYTCILVPNILDIFDFKILLWMNKYAILCSQTSCWCLCYPSLCVCKQCHKVT